MPDGIETFIVRSNAIYGGVTNDIGLDPFADNGLCAECGHLNDAFLADLLLIKQGHLQVLLDQAAAEIRDPSVIMTPFGWSILITLAILIIAVGLIWGIDSVIQASRHQRVQANLRHNYPREMDQLDKISEALAIEPPPGFDASELQSDFIKLQSKLKAELIHQSSPDVTDNPAKIKAYRDQLNALLQDLNDGIAANADGRREAGL